MVTTLGYLVLALVALGFVVCVARELRRVSRHRAIARDLEACRHPLPSYRDGQGVPRRAVISSVSFLPAGQHGLDHDDAA